MQFIDDPFLKSEQRSCPVQLPLSVSGWGFREEFSKSTVKLEKSEEGDDPMESGVVGNYRNFYLYSSFLAIFIVTQNRKLCAFIISVFEVAFFFCY